MSKIPRCKAILVGDCNVGKSSILQRFLEPNSPFKNIYSMTQGVNISFKQVQINSKSSSSSSQNVLGLSNNLSNNLNLMTPPAKTLNKIVSFDEDDEENQNADVIELFVYDIGGHRVYIDLLKSICNNVSMVIGVFDLSKGGTLERLKKLIDDLMVKQFQTSTSISKNNSINEPDGKSNVIGVIIGNKADLASRGVNEQEAQTLAKKHKFSYFECSAKLNTGIEEVFTFLSTKFLEQFLDD